ncbi:oligosaccharide repeat unit polymerase [Priestia megaterium]|uniref:O-antigen polymerase n=1 Tax=Priestia megaterium TaxID=1404 RepID=UPI002040A0C6|nr:O-antigen polymerase [Priestia megaterium]MCM3150854.1 oligosaccharide repeat unit polymerase [Priestia megaterium]
MIFFTYVFITILMVFFTKVLTHKYFKPNIIFTFIWSLSGLISKYYNLGLLQPRNEIYIYTFVMIITFNVVYLLLVRKKLQNPLLGDINKAFVNKKINYKKIYLAIAISFILISPNMVNSVITLIHSGFSLDEVRKSYVALTYSGDFVYVFLTNNVPVAIITAISLWAALDLLRGKKKILLPAILMVLLGTITFGGRYLILNFIVFYVAGFIVLKRSPSIKIKKKYILLTVVVLGYITFSRGVSETSFSDMFALYYSGSFSYLELMLSHPHSFGLNDNLHFGYLMLGFLFEPLVMILKLLFRFNIDVPSYYFNIYAQPFVNIGMNKFQLFNNNTSVIYTFLRDFGIFGLVIGPSFIASLMALSENRYYRKGDLRSLVFLIYMYTVIFNSTMMYTLTSISSSLILLSLFVLSKEKGGSDNAK